jgi:hypothetical protein
MGTYRAPKESAIMGRTRAALNFLMRMVIGTPNLRDRIRDIIHVT